MSHEQWIFNVFLVFFSCVTQHELHANESVLSALFHPRDEDILVTYGDLHLTLWQLTKDKNGTERKTPLLVSSEANAMERGREREKKSNH